MRQWWVRAWGLRAWKPKRVAQTLRDFARAEECSRIDLQAAANRCTDPARAALYLQHARDEARHTRMLARQAQQRDAERGIPSSPWIQADCDGLFEQLGERQFLAFVHHGERRAAADFTTHQTTLQRTDSRTASVFAALLPDETRHAAYTLQLLQEQAGPLQAQRDVARAIRWERWRSLQRTGRQLARGLWTVSLWGLLPVLWLVGQWLKRQAPNPTGWQTG